MQISAATSAVPAKPADRVGNPWTNERQLAQRISATQQLSPDQQRVIAQLQSRDRAVRAHEAAHQASGGGHTGAASFSYQIGPDGRQYAVGGEVPVDLSTERDPHATITKMAQVRAAALAPADPSAADRAVAAAAAALSAAAQRELIQLQQQQQAPKNSERKANAGNAAGSDTAEKKRHPPSIIGPRSKPLMPCRRNIRCRSTLRPDLRQRSGQCEGSGIHLTFFWYRTEEGRWKLHYRRMTARYSRPGIASATKWL